MDVPLKHPLESEGLGAPTARLLRALLPLLRVEGYIPFCREEYTLLLEVI